MFIVTVDNCCCFLQGVLPVSFKYLVHTCTDTGNGLAAVLYVNLKTEEQALNWVKEYEEASKLTFRVARTWPDTGLKLLFKVKFYRIVLCCLTYSNHIRPFYLSETTCKAFYILYVSLLIKCYIYYYAILLN